MFARKRFKKREVSVITKEDSSTKEIAEDKPAGPILKIVKGGKPLEQTQSIHLESDNETLNFLYLLNESILKYPNNVENLASKILPELLKVYDANASTLWMLDEESKNLSCYFSTGDSGQPLKGEKIQLGKGIIGEALERKICLTYTKNQLTQNFPGIKINPKIQNILVIPLYDAEHLIGAVEVYNKKEGSFTQEDKYQGENILTSLAIHLSALKISQEDKTLIRKMNTFKDLHEVFSSTLELDKLLSIVLTKAIELLQAEVGSIWLLEDSGEGIECHTAEGPTKDKIIGVKLKKNVGIIGWVAENKEPLIVEDCSKDTRFSQAVDKKIDFVTRSMISVPLLVKGECIGAIQIINKKDQQTLFNREDMELLALFAGSSAMYIKNARLFASEKKAKELSALINIGKEISSTLDLDAVLMSVVNLSSQIVPYEKAGISLLKRGKDKQFEIRAISGKESIDYSNEQDAALSNVHNELAQKEKEIYVADIDTYKESDQYLDSVFEYMQTNSLQSFWGCPLSDDQGTLGVLSMEAAEKNLMPLSKRELVSLLVSQATVALRNAELYNTIPDNQIINRFKLKAFNLKDTIKEMSRAELKKMAAIVIGVMASLFVIHIPHNINANVEIIPIANTYYASGKSTVQSIRVLEGQHVKKGDLLIELDVTEQLVERSKKIADRQKVISEMLKLRSEYKVADYVIKEKEKISLDYEIALLDDKIELSKIKSESDGVVITAHLDDLLGKPVSQGDELIKVASLENMYVQFQVEEENITQIKSGQEVKFKVYGHPNSSFSEDIKLLSVGAEATQLTEQDPTKYFMATAKVSNQENPDVILRSGMTGRGKIYAEWKSLAYKIFYWPLKFLMMEVFF